MGFNPSFSEFDDSYFRNQWGKQINSTCDNELYYTRLTTKEKQEPHLASCLQVKLPIDPHTKRKRSDYGVHQFSFSLSKLLEQGCCNGKEEPDVVHSIPLGQSDSTACCTTNGVLGFLTLR